MSDTPITNRLAVTWELKGVKSKVVDMESCQIIERDLNRVTAELAKMKSERDALLSQRAISPWKPVSEPPNKSGDEFFATDGRKYFRAEYNVYQNEWVTYDQEYLVFPTHWMEIPELMP